MANRLRRSISFSGANMRIPRLLALLFLLPVALSTAGCSTKAAVAGSIATIRQVDPDGGGLRDLRQLNSGGVIRPGQPFQIVLNRMFIRYLESIDGEVLLYCETTDPENPDPFGTGDRRLLYHKIGQPHSSFLPVVDAVVYGPAKAPEHPLLIRLVLVELDKSDNESYKATLDTAQKIVNIAAPGYAEVANIAAAAAKYIIAQNTDDIEFDLSIYFYPSGATLDADQATTQFVYEWDDSVPRQALVLPLQTQKIVAIKDEHPRRMIPPEDILHEGAENLAYRLSYLGTKAPDGNSLAWDHFDHPEPILILADSELTYKDATELLPSPGNGTLWAPEEILLLNIALIPVRLLLLPSNSLLRPAPAKMKHDQFTEKTYAVLSVTRASTAFDAKKFDAIHSRDRGIIKSLLVDPDKSKEETATALNAVLDAVDSYYGNRRYSEELRQRFWSDYNMVPKSGDGIQTFRGVLDYHLVQPDTDFESRIDALKKQIKEIKESTIEALTQELTNLQKRREAHRATSEELVKSVTGQTLGFGDIAQAASGTRPITYEATPTKHFKIGLPTPAPANGTSVPSAGAGPNPIGARL